MRYALRPGDFSGDWDYEMQLLQPDPEDDVLGMGDTAGSRKRLAATAADTWPASGRP